MQRTTVLKVRILSNLDVSKRLKMEVIVWWCTLSLLIGKAWKKFFQGKNGKFSDHSLSNPISGEKTSKPSIFPQPWGHMHALKAAGQETCGSHLDLGTVLLGCLYLPQHRWHQRDLFSCWKEIDKILKVTFVHCLLGPPERTIKRHTAFQSTRS